MCSKIIALLATIFFVPLASSRPTLDPFSAISKPLLAARSSPNTIVDSLDAVAGLAFGQKHGWSRGGQNSKCDMSKASLPLADGASTPLPSPSGRLVYIALGRGTQNYTCNTEEPSSAPVAVGALASLYDASCVASDFPALLKFLPQLALAAPDPSQSDTSPFMFMQLLGRHYFAASSPVFNLDTVNGNAGYMVATVQQKMAPPANAPQGPGVLDGATLVGGSAVPWLHLGPLSGAQQGTYGQRTFSEVYRVRTAGGSAPNTCEGMESDFQMQYSAEYWIYSAS